MEIKAVSFRPPSPFLPHGIERKLIRTDITSTQTALGYGEGCWAAGIDLICHTIKMIIAHADTWT